MLRHHADREELQENLTILDSDDRRRLPQQVIGQEHIEINRATARL